MDAAGLTDRRFERGLKALLDGFEANLKNPKKL